MLELPDIEVCRRYINATSLHQKINKVVVVDSKILQNLTAAKLDQELKGLTFRCTRRHGNYLLILAGESAWLALRFGNTGYLRYYKDNDQQHEPNERLRFDFDNGYRLCFCDPRRLGSVRLLSEPDELIEDLGPDALTDLSPEELKEWLADSNAAIKSILMDQQKIAGIGNIYADEILFQARIHPQTPANLLRQGELNQLHKAIGTVLAAAIQAKADIDQLPSDFLLKVRKKGEPCPRGGSKIEKITLHGHSTYYCPRCQPAG